MHGIKEEAMKLMGRRPFLRTLPSWVLLIRKFPGKMLTLPGPSLLVAALPPRLESVRAFLYYAAFGLAPGLSSLLPLGLSPDMGSIPSTIPPTDADSLAAVILSTFAELTPEVTSVPLELTAPSSIASAEQESLLPLYFSMKRRGRAQS